MATSSKARKLQREKQALTSLLRELEIAYKKGLLNKEEYAERKYKALKGRFEEDVLAAYNKGIEKARRQATLARTGMALLVLMLVMAPFLDMSGITSLVVFDQDSTATMALGETYVANTTKSLEFINTTSVRVSGKVYGHGEAWVYLRNSQGRKLVYYADTRAGGGITGMVPGMPINDTPAANNSKGLGKNKTDSNQFPQENATAQNQTTPDNTTAGNVTEDNTTQSNTTQNQTIPGNETQANATADGTENTGTETNITTNTTTNITNSTTNTTEPEPSEPMPTGFSVTTDRNSYGLGANVSITVTPENTTITLYMHAPSQSYILDGNYWTAQESGNHTVTALITHGNTTERVSTTFRVRNYADVQTAEFTNACVETCSMQETSMTLEIVLNGAALELDSVTYTPVNGAGNGSAPNQTQNNTQGGAANNTAGTPPQEAVPPGQQRVDSMRSCLQRNPNLKPRECFTQEELRERFPDRDFRLVNELGSTMAVFDGQGSLRIEGRVREYSSGTPQEYDFVVRRNDGSAAAWIDAATGDLHLRGEVVENQEILMWETRNDYVISNPNGMYLAIFDAQTGNLKLRGEVR